MKIRLTKKLLKREYLRGYIDALPKGTNYSMFDLDEQYRIYKKANPTFCK